MQKVKNSKTARSVSRLSHLLETILASKGGYLADSLYAFKRTVQNDFTLQAIPSDKPAKLLWLILSREHYFETTKEYPIANKRELKQALRFDDNKAPFEGVTLHHIERINEQSHRVTFWVINPKALAGLPNRPWLIFPESYLLANALKTKVNLATIACLNKTLFISKTGQGLFSGVQSSQTANIESFAFSTGSPINTDSEHHFIAKADDFIGLLITGLKSLNYTHLPNFLVSSDDINWQNYPWKQAGVITSIVLAIYLALSSGWLVVKQQQLEQQLSEQTVEVNQALTLQKAYQLELQWKNLLVEPVKDLFPYWNTWPIVLDAISVGAEFTAIHYENSKIILDGTANDSIKATDVLAKLSENAHVKSPSFSQPVRKYRGKEDFAISFSFAKPLSPQTAKQTAKQEVE